MILSPANNIWYHTKNSLYPLYEKRVQGLLPEMDCHAQAAQIYAPHHLSSDRILDAGGGSGYFYHSLAPRNLLGSYHLLDQNLDFINLGRQYLPSKKQKQEHTFIHSSIEETPGQFEAIFCLNTLFNLPDYRQGLERLLLACRKIIILRTTLASNDRASNDRAEIRYEVDDYLDPTGAKLKSYFNIWPLAEVAQFMAEYGFKVTQVIDSRTKDQAEISAGKLFPWRWLVGTKGLCP